MVRSRQGSAGRREPGPAAAAARRPAPAGERRRAGPPSRPRQALGVGLGFGLVVAVAAVLRFWALARAPVNPFYDAAVRSMGLSWHNFFFGALEPGGRIAVDKPPIDLWLQVASTKLIGFNTTALLLPEALGGSIAAGLLFVAIRPAFGLAAALIAGLALAVLPISVVTSRSDTMDSVMMALLVGALWATVRGLGTRRIRWVLVAAGLVGVAFNVKLSEALIPLPALGLMWLGVARGRRRLAAAAGAATALVAVAMVWIVVASLTPARERPYPIGSRNGSIYAAVFVYNGVERLNGTSAQVAPVASASPAGPERLFASAHPFYGPRVGVELVAVGVLGLAALLSALLPRLSPVRRRRRSNWATAKGPRPGARVPPAPGVARPAQTLRRPDRSRARIPSEAPRDEVTEAQAPPSADARRAPTRPAAPPPPERPPVLAPPTAPTRPADPEALTSASAAGAGTAKPLAAAPRTAGDPEAGLPLPPRRGRRRARRRPLTHNPATRSPAFSSPPAPSPAPPADDRPRPRPPAPPLPPPVPPTEAPADVRVPVYATRGRVPTDDPVGSPRHPTTAPVDDPALPTGEVPAAPPGSAGAEEIYARRWLVLGLSVWVAIALVLFSGVRDLQPRYLEAVSPAVAAALGIGIATLLRRARRALAAALVALALALYFAFVLSVGSIPSPALTVGGAAAGLALVILLAGVTRPPGRRRRLFGLVLGLACTTAVLAPPVGVSVDLVDTNATAAGVIGAGDEFAPYIHVHRHGAYYEVASSSVYAVTTLIVKDAQPVLILNDFHGPVVSLTKLMDLVRLRAVRHIIITHACTSGPHCPPTTRWSLRHAREVVRGGLYEYLLPLVPGTDPCSAVSRTRLRPSCHPPPPLFPAAPAPHRPVAPPAHRPARPGAAPSLSDPGLLRAVLAGLDAAR